MEPKKKKRIQTNYNHQTTKGENKRREEKRNKTKSKAINKMAIRLHISIITLNVNGLNAPIKRYKVVEWIHKKDPHICCLQETHFTSRDTYKLKGRGWKKIYHANRNQEASNYLNQK